MFSRILKSSKMKFLVCFVFLLYFFSNNNIYATLQENDEYLIPIGNVLQIDAELDGILVRNEIKNSPFALGDTVVSINDNLINNYSDFSKCLYSLSSEEIVNVLVNRGAHQLVIRTNKDILEQINFNSLISGFATLTYINPVTKEFAAVAHPISVGNCRYVNIKKGIVSTTTNLNIEKSMRGSVGSLSATKKDVVGNFDKNTDFGIKGKMINFNTSNLQKYRVASLSEVKLGKAYVILQDNNNECKKFTIEILEIENQKHAKSKTFKIKITDKRLLSLTGGIVQGMSGTPIVQDDKIVGAISHALENDPSTGYGVYIRWMIEK